MKLSTAAVVAAMVLLTGCGDSPASTTDKTQPADRGPQRIVSLSATATEMLFAISAGPQVVAVDSTSNFPAEAPKTDLSAYEPSAEAIAKHNPDLVVITDDTKGLKAQLQKLLIPVMLAPAAKTIDDTYRQITAFGEKTRHESEAKRLVTSMRKRIDALLKDLPVRAQPLSYFHELDNTLYTVTSKTFIGQLYALAGLTNIADPADAAGGGYPQLSAEYLLKADPDLVFLGDTKCCGQTPATYAKRPGFNKLQAVKKGQVVPLDDDIASRWGPRIVDLLRKIIDTVKAIRAA